MEQGKARYLGESNYGAWRHAVTNAAADRNGWPRMVSAQNHYNILRRHVELEILPYCRRYNVAFLPYFPLGGGFLTGKYQPGEAPPPGSRGAEGSGIIAKTRNERNEAILAQLEASAPTEAETSSNWPSAGSLRSRPSPASSPERAAPRRSRPT